MIKHSNGKCIPLHKPYRSVLIGIPIPSLIAYHHDAIDLLSRYVAGVSESDLETLKHFPLTIM